MRQCECGCGEASGVYATTTDGHRKGEPRRFVNGHNSRGGIAGGRPFEPLEKRYAIEDRGYETPCWIWQRTLTGKGYGMMWDPNRKRLVPAHRYFYEHFVGPIPEGLHFDHLCRVHACVNPSHGEPVTTGENQRRGVRVRIPDEVIERVRELAKSETSVNAISRAAGISHPTATAIVRGTYWR